MSFDYRQEYSIRPSSPARMAVKKFLDAFVTPGDSMEDIRREIAQSVVRDQQNLANDLRGLRQYLASSPPEGELVHLVAYEIGRGLEDESDARGFLETLATMLEEELARS